MRVEGGFAEARKVTQCFPRVLVTWDLVCNIRWTFPVGTSRLMAGAM